MMSPRALLTLVCYGCLPFITTSCRWSWDDAPPEESVNETVIVQPPPVALPQSRSATIGVPTPRPSTSVSISQPLPTSAPYEYAPYQPPSYQAPSIEYKYEPQEQVSETPNDSPSSYHYARRETARVAKQSRETSSGDSAPLDQKAGSSPSSGVGGGSFFVGTDRQSPSEITPGNSFFGRPNPSTAPAPSVRPTPSFTPYAYYSPSPTVSPYPRQSYPPPPPPPASAPPSSSLPYVGEPGSLPSDTVIARFSVPRVRCGVGDLGQMNYQVSCWVAVAGADGSDVKATAKDPDLTLNWNKEVTGNLAANCREGTNSLSYECETTLMGSVARLKVDLSLKDAMGTKYPTESALINLPYGVVASTVVPHLGFTLRPDISLKDAAALNFQNRRIDPRRLYSEKVAFSGLDHWNGVSSTCVMGGRAYVAFFDRVFELETTDPSGSPRPENEQGRLVAGAFYNDKDNDLEKYPDVSHALRLRLGRQLQLACGDSTLFTPKGETSLLPTLFINDYLNRRVLAVQPQKGLVKPLLLNLSSAEGSSLPQVNARTSAVGHMAYFARKLYLSVSVEYRDLFSDGSVNCALPDDQKVFALDLSRVDGFPIRFEQRNKCGASSPKPKAFSQELLEKGLTPIDFSLKLVRPKAIVFDRVGNLFLADSGNNRILSKNIFNATPARVVFQNSWEFPVIDEAGVRKYLEKGCLPSFVNLKGATSESQVLGELTLQLQSYLPQVWGLAIRGQGLYFSEYYGGRIRRIALDRPTSSAELVAGNGCMQTLDLPANTLNGVASLAFLENMLLIADTRNAYLRRMQVEPTKKLANWIGGLDPFQAESSWDVPILNPTAIAIERNKTGFLAPDPPVLFAESTDITFRFHQDDWTRGSYFLAPSSRIRRKLPTGEILTVAGRLGETASFPRTLGTITSKSGYSFEWYSPDGIYADKESVRIGHIRTLHNYYGWIYFIEGPACQVRALRPYGSGGVELKTIAGKRCNYRDIYPVAYPWQAAGVARNWQGPTLGTPLEAELLPFDFSISARGMMVIAEAKKNQILKLDLEQSVGTLELVAGGGQSRTGGSALETQMRGVAGVAWENEQAILVLERGGIEMELTLKPSEGTYGRIFRLNHDQSGWQASVVAGPFSTEYLNRWVNEVKDPLTPKSFFHPLRMALAPDQIIHVVATTGASSGLPTDYVFDLKQDQKTHFPQVFLSPNLPGDSSSSDCATGVAKGSSPLAMLDQEIRLSLGGVCRGFPMAIASSPSCEGSTSNLYIGQSFGFLNSNSYGVGQVYSYGNLVQVSRHCGPN